MPPTGSGLTGEHMVWSGRALLEKHHIPEILNFGHHPTFYLAAKLTVVQKFLIFREHQNPLEGLLRQIVGPHSQGFIFSRSEGRIM